MAELLAYSLAVSLMMIALHAFTRLALQGHTFHGFNRGVMLAALTLALAMPLLIGPAQELWRQLTRPSAPVGVVELAQLPAMAMMPAPEPAAPRWLLALVWAYGGGVLFFALRLLAALLQLGWIILRSRPAGTHAGHSVVASRLTSVPFSWGRWIVVPQGAEVEPSVLMHEAAHLRHAHWLDLLLAEAAIILAWYCPAAWLMRRDLVAIHEYQADADVLSRGVDARQYQLMLIKKAAGSGFHSMACSLNHSNIYKRIKMMLRKKSGPAERMRALLGVPVVALSVALLSGSAVASALTTVGHAKVTNFSPTVQEPEAVTISAADIRPVTDPALQVQPSAMSEDSIEWVSETPSGTQGKVRIGVPKDDPRADSIKTELRLRNVKLDRQEPTPIAVYVDGVPASMDDLKQIPSANIASINVVKTRELLSNYLTPEQIEQGWSVMLVSTKKTADAPEQMPSYPGGETEMMKKLAQSIIYPEEAINKNEQGRVVVQFVVDTDGSICEPRVVRSVSPSLDAEAIRVVSNNLGKFNPGLKNGEPVRVWYTLPVNFRLQADDPADKK